MENVRMAVLSADEKICAFFDNLVPEAMHYREACLHTYLQGSAYTMKIETDTYSEDTQYLVEGNKIAFVYKSRDYMCNIVSVERTETDITIDCLGLLLELTNETRDAYKSNGSMTFKKYLDYADPEHVLTLGINEVSDKSIANEWESGQAALARLYSIANLFDAELEFVTELNSDYSLKQIILNVYREHDNNYQGVGTNRTDQILRFGTAIDVIRKKTDITDLYTAIHPTGKDGLDISSLNGREVKDEDGNIEFVVAYGNIYAKQARARFPSAVGKEGYIGRDWTYDTENVEVLYGQALATLKKNCVPQVTYEITGYYDANIGDTFTIVDDRYRPMLILEARVTEQEEYFVDPTKNQTTYSNAVELKSEINSGLLAAMQKLIADKKLYICNISTDNGTIFKNGVGTTTLTAQVKDGAIDITDKYVIQWYKDGNALTAAKSVTVSATDVTDKAVYKFIAYDDKGSEVGQYEVTLTNVSDGADGAPGEKGAKGADGQNSYTHIRYAMDVDGTGMTDKPSLWESSGRNLLQESNFPTNIQKWVIRTAAGITIDETTKYRGNNSVRMISSGSNRLDISSVYFAPYTKGDIITLSVYVMCPDISLISNNMDCWIGYRNEVGSATYSNSKQIKPSDFQSAGSGNWFKWTITGNSTHDSSTRCTFMCATNSSMATVYVSSPKLEKGDTPTPWTPAPEDYPEDYVQPYIGICTTTEQEAPTDPTRYTWSKYVGEKGETGSQGPKGDTGAQGPKGDKGDTGATGASGSNGQNAITGELSLSPIILSANASGAVSNYTDAKGNFKVLDGATEATSGVVYSLVSATGVTVSVNSSTGAYTVSSMPNDTDYGTAMLKAVYKGITIQKILAVIKAKQGAKGETGSTGEKGDTGDSGIIISDTAPTNPYVGQLWQTASGEPVKRWNGSQWVLWYLDVENLNVENLAAIAATIGTVSNPYTTEAESEWTNEALTGEITIGGAGIKNVYTQTGNQFTGEWRLNPQNYYVELRNPTGALESALSLSADGFEVFSRAVEGSWVIFSTEKMIQLIDLLQNTSFTPLTSGRYGCLKLANGFMAVWGATPNNSLVSDTTVGGYSANINLSGYGFTGAALSFVSPRYGAGLPKVAHSWNDITKILKLTSDVNVSGAFVDWAVIGAWK